MSANNEKICKGKNCQKILPADYKYHYCESCRNKRNDRFKTAAKGALTILMGAASIITGKSFRRK